MRKKASLQYEPGRRKFIKIAVAGALASFFSDIPYTYAENIDTDIAYGIDIFEGMLVTKSKSCIEIEIEGSTRTLLVNTNSEFWKGIENSYDSFKEGDIVLVKTHGSNLIRAWSNLDRILGVVVESRNGSLEVACESCNKEKKNQCRVILSDSTVLKI